MQQPTQHIPMNLGQPSGSRDPSAHQGGMFPAGLPHSSMPTDLTSALNLLPPELLQPHQQQQMQQLFGQLASSQPGAPASIPPHLHAQLQPGLQSLLGQQIHAPQSQPTQLPDGPSSRQQQSRQRPQQQRQSSQQHLSQPSQQNPQGSSSRSQAGNAHLTPQPQQPPNLAHLLGSGAGPQPSLLQEHASILSNAQSSVSNFSQSLHNVKQATPADRGDIRDVLSMLERSSKALASELDQGVSKLRALSNSPAYNNMAGLFNGTGANLLGQGVPPGHDLFGALGGFGLPGPGVPSQQQQSNPSGLPFDLGLGFQQSLDSNGMFNLNGARNANDPSGAPGPFNGAFPGDIGARGNNQQGAGALPALLAQYLSQTTDQTSRAGALSLFQSLANGNASGPLPASMQSLEALLSQGSSHQQHQARTGMPGMDGGRASSNQQASSLPGNGAPLTNAAALAALTSLGITPTMLDALGLGSVAQQMLDAPVDASSKKERSSQPASHTRASPEARDDSPEADHSDHFSEPARKKRKQGRSKTIGPSSHISAEAGPSKPLSHDADPSSSRSGRVSTVPLKDADSRHRDRNIASSSKLSSTDTSKRIPTLGVGLRQEGDKRYRNRKLLRDLREHLYRWLGTDEFRKLRSTYKVAEWVPNPHLTDEEKQILASLPPGAVAQPPITTQIFHVDFTSRDFYRTNQSLIDAIVTEGSKKVEAKPEAYAIVPGTIDRDHLEDVAKDLMDSARSGFRMSLRTGLQAEKEDKEKHEKYRGVERAKTKCRNREIGASRLRHAIPKQLLVPGAYSDDAASDEDLHGLTKSEWKRQRLRKLRIAKGWEAVTPKWRNKHLTRAYHKADIVSKSKQMARWRRDDPVDLPIPIKLYGKLLPKQLFDAQWLHEHRKELEDEPYCIRINENAIDGWDEAHHPLGEDTSDEMDWSDAKESSRGRQFVGVGVAGDRGRGEMTESPVPVVGLKVAEMEGKTAVKESSDPPVETGPATLTAEETEAGKKPEAAAAAVSEGSGTSSVSSGSRSGVLDAGDTGGSDTDSDSSLVLAEEEDKAEVEQKAQPPSLEADFAGKRGDSTEEAA